MLSYRDLLQREFEKRRLVNVRYSMRAFARDLNIAPSRLSEVLNNRRGLSQEKGEVLARRLRFPKSMRDYFVTSIGAEHGRSALTRKACKEQLVQLNVASAATFDQVDTSHNIVAWYYGAVLELPRVLRQPFSTKRAATLLGLSHFQVESAVRYLKRLGFWTESLAMGPLRKQTSRGLPKRILRLNPLQISEISANHLPANPDGNGVYQAHCLAFSEQDMAQVKDILHSTSRELFQLAETSVSQNAVYLYTSHLVKLTKGTSDEC